MKGTLESNRVAVTSGPTRAPIDAIRYISNFSTGALGSAIAEECLREGAAVTFFRGTGSAAPAARARLEVIEVETVDDLIKSLRRKLRKGRYNAFFHAMAVLDYVPERAMKGKIRSGRESITVRLVKTPKVINLVRQLLPQTVLVGFKLEVGARKDGLAARANGLMRSSRADLVFANDLRTVRRGRHVGYLLDREGKFRGPFRGEKEIAGALVEAVKERIALAEAKGMRQGRPRKRG